MADVIQLLPDSIANQIAAGEVIQRPASVVKELLENAVDAKASHIKILVRDSGKTLIQVSDDGLGMSPTDARMCFERHATSKIRKAQDLFSIQTMGFRGEALASMASVAQVVLKSRTASEEVGTCIKISAGEFISQEPCECPVGTQFIVKNLFFNIPARRKFLKSNAVEMRHIIHEFQHITIAQSSIHFSLFHNEQEVFHLPPNKLRQRIVGLLGSKTNQQLVPVEEETDLMAIDGYVGKPEFSKRVRGQQFLFVNNRYIRSAYFNHAVFSAYEEILPEKHFPLYVLFIRVDPSFVDVNIHPTKQEVKFEDERLVYNYIKVAVRHALGKHQVIPTLDFNQEPAFTQPDAPSFLNPKASGGDKQRAMDDWKLLMQGDNMSKSSWDPDQRTVTIESDLSESPQNEVFEAGVVEKKAPYQIHHRYIVSQIKSGFLLIDQQAASERIIYEKYLAILESGQPNTQKLLFPQNIQFAADDDHVLSGILPDLQNVGFDIQPFGKHTYVIHGVPQDLPLEMEVEPFIEQCIDQAKLETDVQARPIEAVAKAMAQKLCIKRGTPMNEEETTSLIDQLFACAYPYKNSAGRDCFITYNLDEINKQLSK